jgi:hypothetical protein
MTQQDEGAGWSFKLNPQTDSEKNEYHKPQGEQSDLPEVSNRYIRNNVRDQPNTHRFSLAIAYSRCIWYTRRCTSKAGESKQEHGGCCHDVESFGLAIFQENHGSCDYDT